MENSNWTVYCHTIIENGKRYIGITQQDTKKRWQCGSGYSQSPYFYKAIKKYGWENIRHEILFEHLSEQDAIGKEIELIAEYNTTNNKKGYNVSIGGGGTNGIPCSFETRKKISVAQKGRHLTEEHKSKLSEAKKGKKLSEEHKRKLSESNKSSTELVRSKISKGGKGKIRTNETRRRISEAKKGVPKSEEHKHKLSNISNKTPVIQICKNTRQVISEYESTMEAQRKTGVHNAHIGACCKGIENSAGGYIWEYAEKQ